MDGFLNEHEVIAEKNPEYKKILEDAKMDMFEKLMHGKSYKEKTDDKLFEMLE